MRTYARHYATNDRNRSDLNLQIDQCAGHIMHTSSKNVTIKMNLKENKGKTVEIMLVTYFCFFSWNSQFFFHFSKRRLYYCSVNALRNGKHKMLLSALHRSHHSIFELNTANTMELKAVCVFKRKQMQTEVKHRYSMEKIQRCLLRIEKSRLGL